MAEGALWKNAQVDFFRRKKSISHFEQHEGPCNGLCESSHQEDKLNSSCESWGHNEIFAVWIVHLKWHSEQSGSTLGAVWKLPRSPTGFVNLGCCTTKRAAQVQFHPGTKVTLRATTEETLRMCVMKTFWGCSTPDTFFSYILWNLGGAAHSQVYSEEFTVHLNSYINVTISSRNTFTPQRPGQRLTWEIPELQPCSYFPESPRELCNHPRQDSYLTKTNQNDFFCPPTFVKGKAISSRWNVSYNKTNLWSECTIQLEFLQLTLVLYCMCHSQGSFFCNLTKGQIELLAKE